LAARAGFCAAGACSVSFNVAASLSKAVISRANLLLCFISGQAAHALRARADAKEGDRDGMINQLCPSLSVSSVAPKRARRAAAECPETIQSQQVRAADHGFRKRGE
jgi:hypothetical protein